MTPAFSVYKKNRSFTNNKDSQTPESAFHPLVVIKPERPVCQFDRKTTKKNFSLRCDFVKNVIFFFRSIKFYKDKRRNILTEKTEKKKKAVESGKKAKKRVPLWRILGILGIAAMAFLFIHSVWYGTFRQGYILKFDYKALNGLTMTLQRYMGRPMILIIFRANSEDDWLYLTAFNPVAQKAKQGEFNVTAVALTSGPLKSVREAAGKYSVDYPVFIAEKEAMEKMSGYDFYPVAILTDSKGRIQTVHEGKTAPAILNMELELLIKLKCAR